jgi:hypothetical protein
MHECVRCNDLFIYIRMENNPAKIYYILLKNVSYKNNMNTFLFRIILGPKIASCVLQKYTIGTYISLMLYSRRGSRDASNIPHLPEC